MHAGPPVQGAVGCPGKGGLLGPPECWGTEGGWQGIRTRRGGSASEADTPPGVQPSPLIME